MRAFILGLICSLWLGHAALAGGDTTFNQQGTFNPAAACAKALGVNKLNVQSETSPGGGGASVYFDRDGNVIRGNRKLPMWKVDITCGCYWSRGRYYLFGLISRVIPYCACFTVLWRANYIDENGDGKIGPGDAVVWEGVASADTMSMASGDDTGAAANLAMGDALTKFIQSQGSNGPGHVNFP